MKTFARVAAAAAVSILSVGAASAATITIGSSSATTTYVAGGTGAVTSPTAGVAATNLPNYGVWTAPISGSNWVSNNAQSYPGGTYTAPAGTYQYYTSFTDTTPGMSTGTITVMADDTTSVYLNGTLIVAAASGTSGRCTTATPNCTTPATYNLAGFVSGTNYLTFDVQQLYGTAQGLDFVASINTSAVPEPNSLMLLGTGLIGSAGMFFRRLRA